MSFRGFSQASQKKKKAVASAFGDDDDTPKMRPLPGGRATTVTTASKPKKSPQPASSTKVSTTKTKKATDYTSLLSTTPTYTKYTEQPNVEVDPDATVADLGGQSMAELMGFSGFGKQIQHDIKKKADDKQLIIDSTLRKVSKSDGIDESENATSEPTTAPTAKTVVDEDDDDDDDDDNGRGIEARDSNAVPMTHEVAVKHGAKPLSAMDLDPAGARLVTGSLDAKMKLWDFAAMDLRMKAFRNLEPIENCQIRAIKFSRTGDMMLVCFGSAQLKIMDRDGAEIAETLKGDQYIFDLSKTYGHVSFINDAQWHPIEKHLFITGSTDGTIRVWDTNTTRLNNTMKSTLCGKCRGEQGQKRAPVLSVAYSPDGKLIATACEGGSIQTFLVSGKSIFPKVQHFKAHDKGSDVTSVVFTRKGERLLSRATDGTVKIWDPKKLLKGPLVVAKDMPCFYSMTQCIYSPDEKLVLTGVNGRNTQGMLVILNAETLQVTNKIDFGGVGVVRMIWHSKINQIAVSTTDGAVKILYDSKTSRRGAMFCVSKAPRKADALGALGLSSFGSIENTIHAPHVHKMYREDDESAMQSTKRKREKMRNDKVASKLPQKPLPEDGSFGLGRQGIIRSYQPTFGMHIAHQTSYDNTRDEDPREAILKFADQAAKNPKFVDSAYAMMNNRVEPVLDFDYESDDDGGTLHKSKKFDPDNKPMVPKKRDFGND